MSTELSQKILASLDKLLVQAGQPNHPPVNEKGESVAELGVKVDVTVEGKEDPRVTCRFYLRNACKRGAACSFSHSGGAEAKKEDPESLLKTQIQQMKREMGRLKSRLATQAIGSGQVVPLAEMQKQVRTITTECSLWFFEAHSCDCPDPWTPIDGGAAASVPECKNHGSLVFNLIAQEPHGSAIESFYQAFLQDSLPHSVSTPEARYTVKYTIDKHRYLFNFRTMEQTNLSTHRVRQLMRRIHRTVRPNPLYVQHVHPLFQLCTYQAQFRPRFELEPLDVRSDEYLQIANAFLDGRCGKWQSMRQAEPSVQLLDIQRVLSPRAGRFYELAKQHQDNKSEVMAWHSTHTTDSLLVAREGLDVRNSRQDCYFGPAIYLSACPHYSHKSYRNPNATEQYMLFVKALVGFPKQYTQKQMGTRLVKPPPGFHSVQAVVENDNTIYALYDNSQVYVSHLVHYKYISNGV